MLLREIESIELPLALSLAMKVVRKGQDLYFVLLKTTGQRENYGKIMDIQRIDKIKIADIIVEPNEKTFSYGYERFIHAKIKKVSLLGKHDHFELIVPSGVLHHQLEHDNLGSE